MRLFRLITFFLLGAVVFAGAAADARADFSKFTLPAVKYRGGNFNPRPEALRSLLAQVASRTSIEVNREPVALELTDSRLFRYPFLYMGGNASFEPFSRKELRALRNYLSFGGFLFIDDNSTNADSGFDRSVRKMIARLFPKIPLQRVARDHSVYRSFYLLNQPVGRVKRKPYLEGIAIKGRTVLVHTANDMAGAWSRGKLGHWNHDMVAGGSRQRQLSIRLGVNIVMYSLTLDYKKDMVHLPIILERLRRYHLK